MAVDDTIPEGSAAQATTHPLLRLQELDLSLDRLRARLQQLESGDELTEARARLAEAEARLSDLRLSIAEVEREQRRLEGDIDFVQRKIDAESQRLYDGSVANARELQSIGAEVESLRSRRSRMEDGVLEQMEKLEGLEGPLGPLEAEVAEARAHASEVEETSGRDIVGLERSLGERTAERLDLGQHIDPAVLTLYEDLRKQKRGVGAAALVDGVCQACHQKLSPVYLERLRRTEGVRRCEYCRRILIFA